MDETKMGNIRRIHSKRPALGVSNESDCKHLDPKVKYILEHSGLFCIHPSDKRYSKEFKAALVKEFPSVQGIE